MVIWVNWKCLGFQLPRTGIVSCLTTRRIGKYLLPARALIRSCVLRGQNSNRTTCQRLIKEISNKPIIKQLRRGPKKAFTFHFYSSRIVWVNLSVNRVSDLIVEKEVYLNVDGKNIYQRSCTRGKGLLLNTISLPSTNITYRSACPSHIFPAGFFFFRFLYQSINIFRRVIFYLESLSTGIETFLRLTKWKITGEVIKRPFK